MQPRFKRNSQTKPTVPDFDFDLKFPLQRLNNSGILLTRHPIPFGSVALQNAIQLIESIHPPMDRLDSRARQHGFFYKVVGYKPPTSSVTDSSHEVPLPQHSFPQSHSVVDEPLHSVTSKLHSSLFPKHSVSDSQHTTSRNSKPVTTSLHSVPIIQHSISPTQSQVHQTQHHMTTVLPPVPTFQHSDSTTQIMVPTISHSVLPIKHQVSHNRHHSVSHSQHRVQKSQHNESIPLHRVPFNNHPSQFLKHQVPIFSELIHSSDTIDTTGDQSSSPRSSVSTILQKSTDIQQNTHLTTTSVGIVDNHDHSDRSIVSDYLQSNHLEDIPTSARQSPSSKDDILNAPVVSKVHSSDHSGAGRMADGAIEMAPKTEIVSHVGNMYHHVFNDDDSVVVREYGKDIVQDNVSFTESVHQSIIASTDSGASSQTVEDSDTPPGAQQWPPPSSPFVDTSSQTIPKVDVSPEQTVVVGMKKDTEVGVMIDEDLDLTVSASSDARVQKVVTQGHCSSTNYSTRVQTLPPGARAEALNVIIDPPHPIESDSVVISDVLDTQHIVDISSQSDEGNESVVDVTPVHLIKANPKPTQKGNIKNHTHGVFIAPPRSPPITSGISGAVTFYPQGTMIPEHLRRAKDEALRPSATKPQPPMRYVEMWRHAQKGRPNNNDEIARLSTEILSLEGEVYFKCHPFMDLRWTVGGRTDIDRPPSHVQHRRHRRAHHRAPSSQILTPGDSSQPPPQILHPLARRASTQTPTLDPLRLVGGATESAPLVSDNDDENVDDVDADSYNSSSDSTYMDTDSDSTSTFSSYTCSSSSDSSDYDSSPSSLHSLCTLTTHSDDDDDEIHPLHPQLSDPSQPSGIVRSLNANYCQ